MINKAKTFREKMEQRRSIRDFSTKNVPKQVIIDILMTAGSAPSGANKQPWVYCAISNPEIKKKIKEAAEKIEYETYTKKMSEEWKDDLQHLKTNWKKDFLDNAPWLIVVFKKTYEIVDGKKKKNYYVNESVGLSIGLMITAVHNADLACLTYTPSPMAFLGTILNRPDNEKPYMVIPIGFPKENAFLPEITKKTINQTISFYD